MSPSEKVRRDAWEITEGVDFSWDEPLVGLAEGDEHVRVLLELDEVLRVLRPQLVGLGGVLQRGSAGVRFGPGSEELISGVIISELDTHKQVIIHSARSESEVMKYLPPIIEVHQERPIIGILAE